MDIKSSIEFVEAIKILVVSGEKIAKDGINLADLPEALELLKHVDQLIVAARDFHNIASEMKDIDQAEAIQLGSALFNAFKSIKEA